MKYLYLILLFTLSIPQAWAQQSNVSGTITNRTTGEPITGASIYIEKLKKGATSDFDGAYKLENLQHGSYTISISYIGFETITENIDITRNLEKNYSLEEGIFQLQDVEIVGRKRTSYKPDVTYAGTKTGALVKDVPQSITLLNKELLKDQQIYRITDVVDNVAGLTKTRTGNNFTSRGFRIQQNYVNGNRAVVSPEFSSSSITSHLERVEVIKGPAAALFGNGAPGGVINLVTKKPLKENRASASYTIGSFQTQRATMDITGPLNENKELLYRLNVGWENAESYRDFIKNRNLLLAPSISYIPNDKTSINVDIVSSQVNDDAGIDRGMPILQGDLFALPISFSAAEPYDFRQSTSVLFTVSANHKLSEKLSINASYTKTDFNQTFIETRSNNVFTDDGTELIRQINNRVTDVNADFLTAYFVAKFNTGALKHEMVLGFDYFDNLLDNESITAIGESNGVPNLSFDNRRIYNSIQELQINYGEIPVGFDSRSTYRGYYIQDLITYKKLKIMLGLRYEDLTQDDFSEVGLNENVDNTILLPRLGLTYTVNDNVNIFASYSESFEEQIAPFGTNILNPGEPFNPLAANQIELGVKADLLKDRLAANLSFYSINRSGRLIDNPEGGALTTILQLGDEKSRGVEFEITGKINSNLSITANASFNDVEILDDIAGLEQLELENNNPKEAFGFWGKYDFRNGLLKNLGIGLGGNFVGKSQIIDSSENLIENTIVFDSYFTAKAGLYYAYKKVNVSFNVNNIFDKRYFIGGLNSGRVFPGAPRNYLLTVGYSF
ncbi:TonB-dependent siderophore receptor [Maribacter sp. Asnod1-A12]|uniref:TonB-dependent siderophore receptor n=1 Tax=Maribacter sp. Asnod1-A12 TaxID=3160576 RepID=UPI0038634716